MRLDDLQASEAGSRLDRPIYAIRDGGVCYINELNETVMLKEPRSWKAIQKIEDPI
jgi:hypothetical protein